MDVKDDMARSPWFVGCPAASWRSTGRPCQLDKRRRHDFTVRACLAPSFCCSLLQHIYMARVGIFGGGTGTHGNVPAHPSVIYTQ